MSANCLQVLRYVIAFYSTLYTYMKVFEVKTKQQTNKNIMKTVLSQNMCKRLQLFTSVNIHGWLATVYVFLNDLMIELYFWA